MAKTRVIGCLFAALFLCGAILSASASQRQRINFDDGWRFKMERVSAKPITGWLWTPSAEGLSSADKFAAPNIDLSASQWTPIPSGGDIFKGRIGFAWERTVLPNLGQNERKTGGDRIAPHP